MYRNKTHAEFEMTIPAGDKIRPAASNFNDRFFLETLTFCGFLEAANLLFIVLSGTRHRNACV